MAIKKPKTVTLLFDGEETECLVRIDGTGETLCIARSGRTVKFPAGCDLKAEVKRHNTDPSNAVKPVLAAETEESDAELAAWLTTEGEDGEKETQTISTDDVGSVEDVLGE